MLNEGLIVNDTTALVKSEIVNQIRRLGATTPDELERAVFKALVGHDRRIEDPRSDGNTYPRLSPGTRPKYPERQVVDREVAVGVDIDK